MAEDSVSGFASTDRSSRDEIDRQSHLVAGSVPFNVLPSLLPDPVLVLNKNRQIVFANPAATSVIENVVAGDPVGLRPGEALRCERALESACGCGTSAYCRYCGAANAILSSLRGEEDMQECLIAQPGGETMAFLAHAYPLQIAGDSYSLFMLRDISKERRMNILERVFFHDIKNLLTVFNGWADLLKRVETPDQAREISRALVQLGGELVDEVNAQETLLQAENRSLKMNISEVDSLALLREIESLHANDEAFDGRRVLVDPGADSVQMTTDPSLLKRVLGNMLRNALEASKDGDTVRIGCKHQDGAVRFWVHNPGFIPPEVQSQIFKWSYSTKGRGRGLGTYSMRFLSERYLGGAVSFSSYPEEGTTFEATYPPSLA